ncbi:CHASE2 domain-containing protein [Immundisolibacter sp.]
MPTMQAQTDPGGDRPAKQGNTLRGPERSTVSLIRGQGVVSLLMLAAALLIGLTVHLLGAQAPGLRAVEAGVRDGFARALAVDADDPRIALVDIDEESLRRIGPWPWPRERLADLAERLLSAQRAALVVFDLVLPEGSARQETTGEARLAALGREGLLVPAQAFDYLARDPRVIAGQPGGALAAPWSGPATPATGHVANFPALSGARCVGNVGFTPDFDGQVRQLALLTEWRGAYYPTLALAALQCARGKSDLTAVLDRLRLDTAGRWPIPFARRPDRYLAVRAAAVLQDDALPSLAGRIVLVGSSALGLSDRVATPLWPSTAGVTVHAAALSGLLDVADGRIESAPPAGLAIAWLLLSTLLLWWAIARWQRLRAISVALLGALVGWLVVSAWSLHAGLARPVTPALWSYAWLLGVYLPVEWSAAQARIRARTRLLSRYLARPVLDELLRSEGQDPLAPRHAEISVLIADMEDYTRITAHSTLEEAASLTREFLDCLTRPVLAWRGTLDKYTGDGLVAFWGAPIAPADHAQSALDAALEIRAAITRFNAARHARGAFPVRVRIGLATGRALVGDLGTPFRSTYTAVGDVINLAARLQEAARGTGYDILVSRAMAEILPRHRLRPIGAISLRGLSKVDVFTP